MVELQYVASTASIDYHYILCAFCQQHLLKVTLSQSRIHNPVKHLTVSYLWKNKHVKEEEVNLTSNYHKYSNLVRT